VKVSPIQFFRQVRQEVKKVTWPTKKEVLQVTRMVIVIVALACVFFFCVDMVLAWGVKTILGLGA
jgi:preprotein translocase subunit SecE